MESEFIKKARQAVCEYFNKRVDKTDLKPLAYDDTFVVWFCKTLQNWKALVSTTVPDGMYYEVTYNGDKDECYLDAYKKWENVTYCGSDLNIFRNALQDNGVECEE